MRLLQIIADGRPGGGTTQVLALLEGLKSLDQDLLFVCQRDSYALEQAAGMGIATSGIDFFRSRLDPRVAIKLQRLIRSFRPHVVHVHGSRAGFLSSIKWSNRHRPPVVYTVHGYHFPTKPWVIRSLAALAERRTSRWADITVFVSQHDRRLATELRLLPGPANGTVVYNGIKPEDIPRKAPANGSTVGFIGRLTYQKDPLLFVKIIRILAAEGYTAKIVGGGDMERDVGRSIEKCGLTGHIKLCGSLPRGEALTEISDSAVVVFPSRWEGLPIAPLELMYMGIPVVASDVCGTPEIIEHHVSGVLIQDRDPFEYAAAIRRIVDDSDYRGRLVTNAKRTVTDKFLQQRVTEQYMTLYDTLLSKRRRDGDLPVPRLRPANEEDHVPSGE
ncbi:MAG: glycosyltransferase [Desulfomonilaceae bacterium]|nr:glycosyltransferase [Desulfomonilaceae bacterium]